MSASDRNRDLTAGVTAAQQEAGREKRRVALTSVAAAVLLTGMKTVVGLLTGSLGLLAEAAHSGLDLVAAIITWFAVRVSDKPADAEHLYGHGKVENLSALVETLLLLLTCGWIFYEAINRLFFEEVHIEATNWAFLVMIISIVVDLGRSKALKRVALKHNSQALEADALHFSTDVWSSCVVLAGLILVKLSNALPQHAAFLIHADSVAAMVVALIVVWVSLRLGRRTVDALLDRAPAGLTTAVEDAVQRIDGVLECRRIRVRQSGNQTFVDLALAVRRGLSLESSHALSHAAEEQIKALVPAADVVVHVEPQGDSDEKLTDRIRVIAANHGLGVHNIFITEEAGRIDVELHIETEEGLDLVRAHAQADMLEAAVRQDLSVIRRVTTHIEPSRERREPLRDVTASSGGLVRMIRQSVEETPGVAECHEVTVRQSGRDIYLTMHCTFAAGRTVREVHEISSRLEERLRRRIPHLTRVTTHAEPEPPARAGG